jgi:murein DD-endopeptidase MepM/ murein hydrolase activator NlpD
VGASVRAVADGVVVFAGPVGGVPVVSVAHPDGIRSTYQPVLPRVRTGQVVRRGQLIGILTDTAAHCAPSCLHLGARRGDRYLDPALLLRWRGPRLLPLSGAPPG